MKNNISVTIRKELLEEIKSSFPDKNRSQVIEEALEFWTAHKKKDRLSLEASTLKSLMGEALEIEEATSEDGLDGV